MVINDFSSVIQLSATICIAFVAVEYAKSYTSALCERVFRFNDFIRYSFEECKALLTDRDTLDHIRANNLDGNSTITAIEEAKRKNESLNKKIETEKDAHIKKVASACHAKSMPSICFFLSICNILLLFDGGIECKFPDFAHVSTSSFCVFSTIYLLYGWICGDGEKYIKFFNFSSLRNAITWTFVISLVAIVSGVTVAYFDWGIIRYVDMIWWYILVFFISLTYFNFVVYMVKIWSKAKGFKDNVNESKKILKAECEEAKKDVSDLLGANRLSAKLKTD